MSEQTNSDLLLDNFLKRLGRNSAFRKLILLLANDRIINSLRFIIALTIIGFLLFRLTEIGWGEVLQGLPKTALFYMLFFANYFTLPFAETFIYRPLWQTKFWSIFPALVRKRVLNASVLSYSGEVGLIFWARSNVRIPNLEILTNIRDVNLLSVLVANMMMFVLLVFVFASGAADDLINLDDTLAPKIGLVILGCAGFTLLFFKFRKHIFSLSTSRASKIFLIHCARVFTTHCLQAAIWWSALPEISLMTWVLFLAIISVLSRLPFLPNLDLVFLALSLSLTGLIDAPEAAVAGMFFAGTALGQISNLLSFVLTSPPFRSVSRSRDIVDKL